MKSSTETANDELIQMDTIFGTPDKIRLSSYGSGTTWLQRMPDSRSQFRGELLHLKCVGGKPNCYTDILAHGGGEHHHSFLTLTMDSSLVQHMYTLKLPCLPVMFDKEDKLLTLWSRIRSSKRV